MATVIRNTDPNVSLWVAAHNDLKLQIGAGAFFHLDKSELTITLANATDLATSLALCNNITGVYIFHFADTLAHKIADVTALPLLGAATTLATAITAANLIKASLATHIASTTVNYAADSTNTIAAANATDQGSLNTLLNELKTDINAHMASGVASASLRLVSA